MVFSEIAAATLIAVCGLKRSYRYVLRGEKIVRRQVNLPSPIIEGRDSFPRFVIRRVFRAGLVIAEKWEGTAKQTAQRAAEARMRAISAGQRVAKRAEGLRDAAKDRAAEARARARNAAEKIEESRGASGLGKGGSVRDAKTMSPRDDGTTLKMVRTKLFND